MLIMLFPELFAYTSNFFSGKVFKNMSSAKLCKEKHLCYSTEAFSPHCPGHCVSAQLCSQPTCGSDPLLGLIRHA